ncbi:MAG: hypothetical protein WC730_00135 [Patescibacteria group bacterium]|jgi:hypothetical protein
MLPKPSKNRPSRKVIGLSLFLAGCDGIPNWIHPLDAEQQDLVDDFVIREKFERPIVKDFFRAADFLLFDAKGSSSTNQVIDDVETAGEDLKFFHEDHRIFAYTEEDAKRETGDWTAFERHQPFSKDFIALNERYQNLWSSAVLMHESAHGLTRKASHSKTMLTWLDNHPEPEMDDALAEITMQEKDFPFLVMGFYDAIDRKVSEFKWRIDQKFISLRDEVEQGTLTPKEAIHYIESTMQEPDYQLNPVDVRGHAEDWASDFYRPDDSFVNFLEPFGVTREEYFYVIVNHPDVFNYLEDYYSLRTQEFRAEFTEETRREMAEERRRSIKSRLVR